MRIRTVVFECEPRHPDGVLRYRLDDVGLTAVRPHGEVTVAWDRVTEVSQPTPDSIELVHRTGTLTLRGTILPAGQVIREISALARHAARDRARLARLAAKACRRSEHVARIACSPGLAWFAAISLPLAALLFCGYWLAFWLAEGDAVVWLDQRTPLFTSPALWATVMACYVWLVDRGSARLDGSGLKLHDGRYVLLGYRPQDRLVPWPCVLSIRSCGLVWRVTLRGERGLYLWRCGSGVVPDAIRQNVASRHGGFTVFEGPPASDAALSRVTGEPQAELDRGISLTPGEHDA